MNIQLTIIAQGLTFAILIWFTVKFIWPPLLGAIEKRQKEIADGLAAAHEGQKALQEADLKKEEVLSGAKGKSTEIVTLAEKRANEIIKDAQEKAKIEAELIIKNAQNEVENEVNKYTARWSKSSKCGPLPRGNCTKTQYSSATRGN